MKDSKIIEPGRWYSEFDEEGNCVATANDESYRRILGYKEGEEYSNKPEMWASTIHPDDEERVTSYYAECLRKHPEGMDFDIEYRMQTKRGYRWFHDHAHCTRRADGSVIRCDGVIFDVQDIADNREHLKDTERKLKHEELRSEILNYMVESDDDPIELLKNYAERVRQVMGCDQVIYRDLEETRIMVNSSGIKDTWAVPIEYCRQCEHFDAHHPMYAGGYTEMDNCQEGWQGIPVYHECPIKSSLTRIVYCDGEVAGYLAIHYVQDYHHFTDMERCTLEIFTRILSISLSRFEAKKRASELSGVKRSLDMMFSLSDQFDPIIVLDPETGEYDWYQSKAKEIEELTSMSIHGDDLYKNIGIDGATIIHEEDRAQFKAFYTRENMMEIARTGKAQEIENRWQVGPDNTYLWKYNKAVRVIDENGKVCVAVGVVDTTGAREKERQLEEALKAAEEANRSKTSFLFNMSHDIRTPMNAITGFTGMAKKHIGDDEKVEDYLNKIDASGQQLLTLINQVLEMARIESGKVELEEKPISVHREFDSAVVVLAEHSKSCGLEFVYSVSNVTHDAVLADTARLSSITLNITGNAMKYTPRGGRIEYRLEEIAPRKEGYATFVFSVADTGIGMSEEYQKILFDPFTREKNSTVSRIQGTGLGLSIVKDLVALMGGEIKVKSEQGKGTRFDVMIDFKIVDADSVVDDGKLEYDKEAFAGKRILIVDDNELNREIARDMLEDAGFVIEEAGDGTVAVELLRQKGAAYYDMILMDIQMPIMNGYEATGAIREMYPTAPVPIIALSANAFSEDRQRSVDAGMDDHVSKPIRLEDLLQIMAKHVASDKS